MGSWLEIHDLDGGGLHALILVLGVVRYLEDFRARLIP